MSKRTVFYLVSGAAHLPYLVTSLRSLRQHRNWTGPIQVYAWPESYPYVERIQEDTRLDIVARKREPEYRGKNSQFYHKQQVAASMVSWDTVVYLDADTLIAKPFVTLFSEAEKFGFAATQFNDWMSNVGIAKGRVKRLLQSDELDHDLIQRAITEPWPSLNGGIWGAKPESPVLESWQKWTWPVIRGQFIADEAVLHVIQIPHVEAGEMTVLKGGAYNCSMMRFQSVPDNEVVIWHGHGDCWVRPDKCEKGTKMWWSWYQRSLEENLGGIAEWNDEVVPKNKWLKKMGGYGG